jgi:hypothetical protein
MAIPRLSPIHFYDKCIIRFALWIEFTALSEVPTNKMQNLIKWNLENWKTKHVKWHWRPLNCLWLQVHVSYSWKTLDPSNNMRLLQILAKVVLVPSSVFSSWMKLFPFFLKVGKVEVTRSSILMHWILGNIVNGYPSDKELSGHASFEHTAQVKKDILSSGEQHFTWKSLISIRWWHHNVFKGH